MKMTGTMCLELAKKLQEVLKAYGMFEFDDYPEPPAPDPGPDFIEFTLRDNQYGVSSEPDHLGEYYFIPQTVFIGKIESVVVGETHYRKFTLPKYPEIYYGPPTTGNIVITLKDSNRYRSTTAVGPNTVTDKVFGAFRGPTNGDRMTWYWPKKMSSYPPQFYITVEGCPTIQRLLVINNGQRYEKNGHIIKQSDVPGRGLALVANQSCRGTVSYIEI